MDRHVVATTGDIPPGTHKKVAVKGRDIAVFNLNGSYYALGDRCPHESGSLSTGKVCGLVESDAPGQYRISRPGEFVKCPWHGWEFDIRTGQSYCDPKTVRVRMYETEVASGEDLTKGPYVAETFRVSVEGEYVVIDL